MSASRSPANLLRATPAGDRPQERLQRHGARALSDTELLALLLGTGTRGHDVLSIAQGLIGRAGSLGRLIGWEAPDFRTVAGVGHGQAVRLLAMLELARRLSRDPGERAPQLDRPHQIQEHMQPLTWGLQVEKFWVLCLNRKNRLIRCVEVSSGTATAALAHPREVFRSAIRESAAAVVCVHNHPSGDPAPSAPDLQLTRLLREAARTVEIDLIDHIIVGRRVTDPCHRGYFSFREAGLL